MQRIVALLGYDEIDLESSQLVQLDVKPTARGGLVLPCV